jgi:hypothetical protein
LQLLGYGILTFSILVKLPQVGYQGPYYFISTSGMHLYVSGRSWGVGVPPMGSMVDAGTPDNSIFKEH